MGQLTRLPVHKPFSESIDRPDAIILATADTLGLDEIMTHDEAFKRVDWLKLIDPILKQK